MTPHPRRDEPDDQHAADWKEREVARFADWLEMETRDNRLAFAIDARLKFIEDEVDALTGSVGRLEQTHLELCCAVRELLESIDPQTRMGGVLTKTPPTSRQE